MLTIRGIVIDEYSLKKIIDALDVIDDIYRYHHKQKSKNLKGEIYRYLYKKQNEPNINELKELKRLKKFKKENISQEDLKEIKRLYDLPRNTLKKLAQLRNVETAGLTKSDLIYILLRSQKHHTETKYLEYLESDPVNEIKFKINEIRKYLIELIMLLDKADRVIIKKRLEEIDRMANISPAKKANLLNELSRILLDLEYKRKDISFTDDSDDYYELKDLEYTFGDLDKYCKSILAKESFNGSYQMYTCRGDKNRDKNISMYLDKVRSFLIALIDEKKVFDQKIQLDIAINLRHITKNDRITFYVKSKNVLYLPSDHSEDILEQLINSLLKYYEDKLLICRTDSSYVYESVEGLSIHFHNIDLNRGSSYMPSPDSLKNKGATINPQNTKDNYCFMYAVTIALNHKEIGKNPDRISKKLIEHIPKYNWDYIDFPASILDHKIFEKNNEDIALNILYVPYDTEEIRPEYISKYNFSRKN